MGCAVQHIKHNPHLVQFHGACLEVSPPLLVMEFMAGGDLAHALSNDALSPQLEWYRCAAADALPAAVPAGGTRHRCSALPLLGRPGRCPAKAPVLRQDGAQAGHGHCHRPGLAARAEDHPLRPQVAGVPPPPPQLLRMTRHWSWAEGGAWPADSSA